MVKNTALLLFFLCIVATLLIGINLGKKIGKSEVSNQQPVISNQPSVVSPTTTKKEELSLSPTSMATTSATAETSTVTDQTCGFHLTFPGSYLRQKTENNQSQIFTNPDKPEEGVATACQEEIPKPPLTADKIESIILDGVAATLYHDQNAKDGTPRDEVIVKHPVKNIEIIIAGYGTIFQQALSSFKFLR
ncbi:hypothetical protein MUP32_00995 [Candidatus Microgenomates bacterium]|nr:hypothetical protein [Candidatus Microgenomates bacterium]